MRVSRPLRSLLPFLLCAVLLPAAAADADGERTRQALAKRFGVEPGQIREAPLEGLYEIRLGAQLAYVSADGRYLVQGDIIDLAGQANLTEARRAEMRLELLGEVPESRMIVFPATGKEKHVITVFTDIDCGYCRRLHAEIDRLNAGGVTVHYLFYPRAGVGSASWRKAQNVWCAGDRNAALTRAKRGEEIESPDCGGGPVMEHYQLGERIGVSGTPAIITGEGDFIRGYLPAPQLLRLLDAHKAP